MNRFKKIYYHPIFQVISLLLLLWMGASIGILYLEDGKTGLDEIGNSFWWTIVTITTVGYGDYAPDSFYGRVLAIFLMLAGIGLVSTITGSISSIFTTRKIMQGRGLGMVESTNHVVVCGWNENVEHLLSCMAQIVDENKDDIVLDYLDRQLLAFWGLRYTEVMKCLYNRYLLYPKFVNDKNNVSQLYFSPVKTVEQFDQLIVQVKVITCLLMLLHRSGIDRKLMKSQNLDNIFFTCIARVGLECLFVCKEFTTEEVDTLFSLDDLKIKESVSHFLVSIENFCVNSGLDSNLHIDKSHLLFVREFLFSVFQQFKTAKKTGLNELKKMLLQKK